MSGRIHFLLFSNFCNVSMYLYISHKIRSLKRKQNIGQYDVKIILKPKLNIPPSIAVLFLNLSGACWCELHCTYQTLTRSTSKSELKTEIETRLLFPHEGFGEAQLDVHDGFDCSTVSAHKECPSKLQATYMLLHVVESWGGAGYKLGR